MPTKQETRAKIQELRSKGYDDKRIMIYFSNDKGAFGTAYRNALNDGMSSTDFAQTFGLNYSRAPVQVNQPKNATLGDKGKYMAATPQVTKQQMQNAINGYIKQGLGTRQIHIALAKRKDAIGDSYRDDMKHGTPEEFNGVFGLKLSKGVTAGEVNKNASLGDKVKSYATSAAMGLSDVGAGVIQGSYYLTDKAGITKGAYDKYNKEYDKANAVTEVSRKQAGRKGSDLVRTGTAIAATVPMFIAGDKTAAARGLGLLGRTAVQSGVGATVGAANYAKDGKERKANIIGSAAGSAIGEVGGYALGKGVTKGYNALKGNLKPEYQAVESLGKKFGVRTSAGDTMRNPIIKKTEKLTENMPVVGMSSYREAQHGEVKQAANKVANNLKTKLNSVDYKSLPHIQNAANAGDKNAARIIGIVNNAEDDANKILQASAEIKHWRDQRISSKMYERVQKMAGDGAIAPNKTVQAIDDIIANDSKVTPNTELQNELLGIRKNLVDLNIKKNFKEMRAVQSRLGEVVDEWGRQGKSTSAITKVRTAIDDDILDFAQSSGNPELLSKLKQANAAYKKLQYGKDDAWAKAMSSDKQDEIYQQFIQAGKGDKAANFYGNLDQKGQAALRYKMLEDVINKSTNNDIFSPVKFTSHMNKLDAAYQNIFTGADKSEIDGFRKLVKHLDSAGQYMENPPTGNRVIGGAVGGSMVANPLLLLKGAAATGFLKTMFTTKAGKNLLMAASKLPEGSRGLANVLKAAETVMAASGAQAGQSTAQPTDTQPTIDTAQPADPQPTVDAPVAQDNIPPLQVGDHLDPQQPIDPVAVQMPPVDMSAIGQADAPSLPPVDAQSGLPPVPASTIPDAPQPPADVPQAQPTVINAVGQTLQSLIPPPKDTADPRKMATYEQVSQRAVVSVLNTPQMQQITTELEKPQASDSKIQSLQKSLAKTPEWQSFLQTLPKDQRQQLSSADVLSLVTRNIANMDAQAFNPHF